MNYLTKHFCLEELTHSDIAVRHGIDNTPTPEIVENLKRLAATLEEIRTLLNSNPIHINSAYRSPEVNRLVGSKPTSDHLHGLAADFISPVYGMPDDIVRKIMASNIQFKQVIREFNSWVHLSIPKEGETPKKEALIIDKAGTRIFA